MSIRLDKTGWEHKVPFAGVTTVPIWFPKTPTIGIRMRHAVGEECALIFNKPGAVKDNWKQILMAKVSFPQELVGTIVQGDARHDGFSVLWACW